MQHWQVTYYSECPGWVCGSNLGAPEKYYCSFCDVWLPAEWVKHPRMSDDELFKRGNRKGIYKHPLFDL